MPSQLKKLALIEDDTTDTVLTFSVVQEGASNASRQVIEIEPADGGEVSIENDRNIITSKRYNITVVGLYTSESDRSQLQTWASNQTELNWAGIGLDGQILQGTGQVVFQEDYEDNVSFRFNRATIASGGYSSTTGKHTSGLSYSKNGLALYKWADVDGDGLANGWVTSGFTTESFASGEQTLEAGTSTESFRRNIYFPFENKEITFSLDIDSRTGTYDVEKIDMQFIDTSGSVISTVTTNFSSTGRKSVTGTTPSSSNLSEISLLFTVRATSGTVTSIVSDPALRIGTGTEFAEWNT